MQAKCYAQVRYCLLFRLSRHTHTRSKRKRNIFFVSVSWACFMLCSRVLFRLDKCPIKSHNLFRGRLRVDISFVILFVNPTQSILVFLSVCRCVSLTLFVSLSPCCAVSLDERERSNIVHHRVLCVSMRLCVCMRMRLCAHVCVCL